MNDDSPIGQNALLSVQDAAVSASLSRDYVMRLCRKGIIPARQDADRQWLIEESGFEAFIRERDRTRDAQREKLSKDRATQYREHNMRADIGVENTPKTLTAPSSVSFVPAFARIVVERAPTRSPYTPTYIVTPARETLQKSLAAFFAFLCTFGVIAAMNPVPVMNGFSKLVRPFETAALYDTHNMRVMFAAASLPSASLWTFVFGATEDAARYVNLAIDDIICAVTCRAPVEPVLVRDAGALPDAALAPPAPQEPSHPAPFLPAMVSGEVSDSTVPLDTPASPDPSVIERIIVERVNAPRDGVHEDVLTARLMTLEARLLTQIATTFASVQRASFTYVPQTNGTFGGSSGASNSVSGGTVTNSTISGGSISNASVDATTLSVSGAATFAQATTTALAITSLAHALLSTDAAGNIVATTSLGSGLINTSGNWSGTFDGQEGSYYLANSFSTTSANYLLSSYNKDFFFSTTSTDYWKSQTTFSAASTTLLSDSNTLSGANRFTQGIIGGTSAGSSDNLIVLGPTNFQRFRVTSESGSGAVVVLGADGKYGWTSGQAGSSNAIDTSISRFAAGVVQIGTSAANANGTLLAARAGLGTTTPWAKLSVLVADNASNPQLLVASSTATSLYVGANGYVGIGTSAPTTQLHTTGTVRFAGITNGSLSVDADGNVTTSSDERLKNIDNPFTRGLTDIMHISPITYHWRPETGYDTKRPYSGFSAQNVRDAIPEAIGTDSRGFLTIGDRPILAAVVNAVKEVAQIQGIFRERLISWLGDAANDIGMIFAQAVYTDRLCVTDGEGDTQPVCVTKSQLAAILAAPRVNPDGSVTTTSSHQPVSPIASMPDAAPSISPDDTASSTSSVVSDSPMKDEGEEPTEILTETEPSADEPDPVTESAPELPPVETPAP